LADSTGAAAAQRAAISEKPCGSFKQKWREWRMRNNRLFPYETIVQAARGEPEAVNLFNGFAAFFRSCLAFLKIPSMKKQKGKLPPQLAKSCSYPWKVSKKKYCHCPLSGLRGVDYGAMPGHPVACV